MSPFTAGDVSLSRLWRRLLEPVLSKQQLRRSGRLELSGLSNLDGFLLDDGSFLAVGGVRAEHGQLADLAGVRLIDAEDPLALQEAYAQG